MKFGTTLALTGAAAAAGLTWGTVEARAYTVRRVDVPVLGPGATPLRVLHISDLHMTPGQSKKAAWVRSLAAEDPDLIVNTGDNLAHADSVPVVLEALAPLLERPGVFVNGSNDYYAPHVKNPFGYFTGPSKVRHEPVRLPTADLVSGFEGAGWLNLNNARGVLELLGRTVSFVGVDDPHIGKDKMPGTSSERGDIHLGVAHAPYLRILGGFAADGAALTFAGHTHGGQVCVPGWGALVTNCDLDTRRAKGLHRWRAGVDDVAAGLEAAAASGSDNDGSGNDNSDNDMWFHVSAGAGTSPYVQLRFACRPEATVLTLVPRNEK